MNFLTVELKIIFKRLFLPARPWRRSPFAFHSCHPPVSAAAAFLDLTVSLSAVRAMPFAAATVPSPARRCRNVVECDATTQSQSWLDDPPRMECTSSMEPKSQLCYYLLWIYFLFVFFPTIWLFSLSLLYPRYHDISFPHYFKYYPYICRCCLCNCCPPCLFSCQVPFTSLLGHCQICPIVRRLRWLSLFC